MIRHMLPGVVGIVGAWALAAVVALTFSPHHGSAPAPRSHTLTACTTEDSANCYWDADRGNGTGRSFVDVDGVVYYLPAGAR